MPQQFRALRLLLGDQLNAQHSWFKNKEKDTLYVLMETLSEASYVRHHIQKVIGFFLAMRAFAEKLKKDGHQVRYIQLDSPDNQQSITDNLKTLIEAHGIRRFEYQLPDEYRLDQEINTLCAQLDIETQAFDSEHFLCPRAGVADFFEGKKTYLLENFYRFIRRKYQLLMEEDEETPLTGKWNYDHENRNKLPKKQEIPAPLHFRHDAREIVGMLQKMEVETIGNVEEQDFAWPVSREECLELLKDFIQHRLHLFGTYQDALSERSYLLFHSKLSFAMNVKLLHPLEVCQACIHHWQDNKESIEIAQIEGFIRQIIGWREYMRGIYWAKMPAYAEKNFFGHEAPLPGWYWDGNTKMSCLRHAVGQSLDHAYAHHIQRLMVTGNFALLLGVHPSEVDEWYLGIYMDAIEWVEITNTRGMSQFADGGIVGTKPYVSSANYINKMSHYCKDCHYNHREKYGDKACPFNSLYWDFYDRHADKLSNNPRIGMMYRIWNRMDGEEKEKILKQADNYKKKANEL